MFFRDERNGATSGKRKNKIFAPTIISADMTVTGSISSDGKMLIDGAVDGDVASGRVDIGQAGKVAGVLSAETTMVHGRVEGVIRASDVTLTATAHVSGDIYHETLMVEPGAQVDGQCRPLSTLVDEESPDISLATSDGVAAKSS